MRRFALYIIISLFISLPCYSLEPEITENGDKTVFVYHLPDEEEVQEQEQQEVPDIISDDVTADTSGEVNVVDIDNYELEDMYTAVLQGYAQYNEEDESDGVILEDFNILSLNIRQPMSVGTKKYTSLNPTPPLFMSDMFSKYTGSEYSISPVSSKNSRSFLDSPYGKISAGTLYNQGIDSGELEQSSGVFSKYKYKRFSVTTSYLKTINSTNNTYNDNFYIAPELELNQYFSLKEILSADTVKRRKKAELVLSINPFGKKDIDRLRFELGASQTYDDDNNLFKSQFKFSTNFKL